MTPDGPTLGVLGGMGPAAGAEFLRVFTGWWPAKRDQDHPRVVLLSEPSIPDRSAALRGDGPDPAPQLRDAMDRLVSWGADLLAVPCNTAFAFIDDFPEPTAVPVVHTIAIALAAAGRGAPAGSWLLGTDGCLVSGVYQRHAARLGYPLREPSEAVAQQVSESIDAVKAGALADAAQLLDRAVAALPDTMPPLLACTELSVIWPATRRAGPVVDSLRTLAAECVRRLPHHGGGGDRGQ
jgi:aspartate racemase